MEADHDVVTRAVVSRFRRQPPDVAPEGETVTQPMDEPTPQAVPDPGQLADPAPAQAPPVAPVAAAAAAVEPDPGVDPFAARVSPGSASPATAPVGHGVDNRALDGAHAAPAPQWGEYGSVTPTGPVSGAFPAPRQPDPLRGVLAGVLAAILGALAWALLVALTHYEVAFAALGVGYLVGWAVHRYGGTATTGLAAASAAMAGCGILLGFVLAQLFMGAHDLGIGFLDAVDAVTNDVGWLKFITHSTTGIGWLFLAVGAFGAFRLVAQKRPG